MTPEAFLTSLLETPSPAGAEQRVQRLVRDRVKAFADTVETDVHGNVIAGINTRAKRKVMLAGHCDQIGMMVKHISSDGFLYVGALGGLDIGVLHAARVTVHGEKGPVQGVIGRKPIHLQTGEERDKTKNDIEKIWIDIGAKNRKDAEKRVTIGDCATFELRVLRFGDNLISAPGLDDKVGLYVALETLRVCSKMKLDVALYAVSTVQEELGLRGAMTAAYYLQPDVGIAIDVTHATDNPGVDNPKSIACKLGGGPTLSAGPSTNPIIAKLLRDAAKRAKAPFQHAPSPRLAGNDSASIQVSRGGVATANIGIPNRYMHSQAEVCSMKDLDASVKILAAFVQGLTVKTDLRPM